MGLEEIRCFVAESVRHSSGVGSPVGQELVTALAILGIATVEGQGGYLPAEETFAEKVMHCLAAIETARQDLYTTIAAVWLFV